MKIFFLLLLSFLKINKIKLNIRKKGVEGISSKVEMIGCHKNGLQPKNKNILHGSKYLEITASVICKLLLDKANQNSPNFDK